MVREDTEHESKIAGRLRESGRNAKGKSGEIPFLWNKAKLGGIYAIGKSRAVLTSTLQR